ncbi:MAG: hypothetical protein GX559_00775 [Candidatus Pacebacteria bacterium]|nr:hypothetical protein [Candidatus Paceibacterota bacterium]
MANIEQQKDSKVNNEVAQHDKLNKLRRQIYKALGPALVATMLAAGCVPESGVTEPKPAITQAIGDAEPTPEEEDPELGTEVVLVSPEASETVIASPTLENTPTKTATATPEATATQENTATPEATAAPKELTQAQIRSEILKAGVNLDDLASSTDEWTSSHLALDVIQNSIDHENFGREGENWVTTVVIGLEEAIKNPQELEQAIPTDGGWKLMAFVKVAFKDVSGDWQIAKLPVVAFHEDNNLIWMKPASIKSEPNFFDVNMLLPRDENNLYILDEKKNFINPPINFWTGTNDARGYHHGIGSFIKFFTASVDDPRYAGNDCLIGEPPRYTEEQLIEFRKTGDPHIFGYKDVKAYPIIWPLTTFQADLSDKNFYNNQP